MGPEKRENKRRPPTLNPKISWIDKISGVHTKLFIVSLLFLLIIIILLVTMIIDETIRKDIVSAFIALLSAFGGYIAGDRNT
jgi:hypothetical protein